MPGRSIQPLEIFSQLYIGDYFADTLEFSAEEHAAFRLLLLHIWLDRSEPLEDLGCDRPSQCRQVAGDCAVGFASVPDCPRQHRNVEGGFKAL